MRFSCKHRTIRRRALLQPHGRRAGQPKDSGPRRETHELLLDRVPLGLVQRHFDVVLGGDVRLEVGVERTPARNDDASLDQILGRSIRNQTRVEAARRILCTGKRP